MPAPVHAIAAHRIREVYEAGNGRRSVSGPLNGFLKVIYPKLLRWHRYLLTNRDPERSGLVTIFHPWESGTDNSPRWDAPLERVAVGALPGYMRRDLQHVGTPTSGPRASSTTALSGSWSSSGAPAARTP